MIDDEKNEIQNYNSKQNNKSVKSREQSGNKSYRIKNFLSQENLSDAPEHFPEDRKLSKKEEERLDKIIKCIIYYYCFYKRFMNELENSDGFKEISLCMINKSWLDFFLNKYSFFKIKEYLDKNYENVEQRNFLEYKEGINSICNIKDFILVKTKPVTSLEKEFTEYGQEYFDNYEFINKHTLENLRDLFGSFDIEGTKEYKINILKDKGLIINFSSTKIEVTKKYIKENNNVVDINDNNNKDKDKNKNKDKENSKNINDNNNNINSKKPERYLIVLSNGKHMNYKIKRPLEDNGVDKGLTHIGIEKNENEIDEETYQIKLKTDIIGSLINITNPPNKTLGNFIPDKQSLIKLEKNTNINYLNSVIQCLSNVQDLTGHLLNKKRIQQISIQREIKPLSYEYVEVLKHLWLDENIKTYSLKNITNYIQEANPFLSCNESDIKDLIFFIINNMHQELNKIENPTQYIPNDTIKFNYQLTFEMYLNYYNTNYKSIISDLFYGLKNDTLTCDNCMSTSHSLNYYDIMNYSLEQIRDFKGYSYDTVYVEECFDYNERKIDLYNCKNYFCNFCNKNSNGVLSSKLISIPKILILVMSRKEEKEFDINLVFEEFLNLRKYIFYDSNPYKYELIGVISNINKYDEEQRFVSFCKSSVNKKWYLYDDDKDVIDVKFNDVKEKGKAYVLIYKSIANSK
jgi:ubiquitin C-terminal hydrolase